jgi:hypothetical protein
LLLLVLLLLWLLVLLLYLLLLQACFLLWIVLPGCLHLLVLLQAYSQLPPPAGASTHVTLQQLGCRCCIMLL